MVAIVARARNLHQLLRVRKGTGSAKLSPEVTRIHLDLGTNRFQGNAGAKQFWKEYLPRLKYQNPHIPMLVTRREDSTHQLTIDFASPSSDPAAAAGSSSASKTTPADAPTTSKTISLLSRTSDEILEELYSATSAQRVEPSPEDVRAQAELNEELYQINELKKKNAVIWAEMQREKAIMKAAMGEVQGEKKGGRRKKAE